MFFGDGFSFQQQERTKNIVQSLRVRKDHLEPLVLSFSSFWQTHSESEVATSPGHFSLCFLYPILNLSHTWPLNQAANQERAWYHSYVVSGLDYDMHGLSFNNYSSVSTCKTDSWNLHKATVLLFWLLQWHRRLQLSCQLNGKTHNYLWILELPCTCYIQLTRISVSYNSSGPLLYLTL